MSHGGGDLPQELVYRILVLLPVKSLLRFACVCKLWHDVILRDRNFARDQLEAARELTSKQPSLSHKRLLLSTPKQLSMFHVVEAAESETETETEIKTRSFELDDRVTLLGSCNGFVFFTSNVGGKWVRIWNPARSNNPNFNPWRLPDLEIDQAARPRKFEIDWNRFSGAGYVSATDDSKLLIAHQVFCIHGEIEGTEVKVIEVRLYSLRSNSWKSIDCSDCMGCYGISTVFRESLLHWIDCKNNIIVVFDLGNEDFLSLSLPDFQGVNGYDLKLQLGVSAAQGCLTLVSLPYDHAADDDSFMEFWMMKEYGVAQSWTMLYRISYSSPGLTSCLVVMETCTVATLSRQMRCRLIRINHKEQREKQFHLFDAGERFSWQYSILEYEESLISLE